MRIMTSKLLVYFGFQAWEALVFLIAFSSGMIALENARIITIGPYLHPVFLVILAALAVLWNRLLHGFDLYLSRRLVHRGNEYFGLVIATILSASFLALLGALLGQPTNQPDFLIWFMLVATALLIPGRAASRLLLRAARAHGRNIRFVAIAGAGRDGQALARVIVEQPQMGFQLVGLFDAPEVRATMPRDLPDGGTLFELSQVLTRQPLDEVLVAMPLDTHSREVADVLALCRRTGVSARVVSDLLRAGRDHPQVEMIGVQPCLHFRAEPDWGWQGHAKRLFDIAGAGLGLVALSPFLIAVAILIRLDSKGPALFVQTRVGKNRQQFRFYKFRTMTQDAEAQQASLESQNEAGGPVFKIKSDPRITRLGRFLRKYSIDELPQLLNVLKGDMSLVGPRPLPRRDVDRFEHDWYSRRFSVRPGLTCSWALAGRSELNFEDWVQADLEYIDNWSLLRDVSICLRTIPAVVRGSGAY